MILALKAKHKLYLRANFFKKKSTWVGLGLKPDVSCERPVANNLTTGMDIVNTLRYSLSFTD
jgi:hypothetical protein